jgi:hypothetical protein
MKSPITQKTHRLAKNRYYYKRTQKKVSDGVIANTRAFNLKIELPNMKQQVISYIQKLQRHATTKLVHKSASHYINIDI